MVKKKVISCGSCASPASWYKKGKRHRVLVCPRCGVIASNPIPLIAAGMLAAKYAPAAFSAVKALGGKRDEAPTERGAPLSASSLPAEYYRAKYTAQERVSDALR